MAIFGGNEPAPQDDKFRCEICELMACAYATGVQQQLQLAMWVDRLTRFGNEAELPGAISQLEEHAKEVQQTWMNYLDHRNSH